jgi:hypothetical protein
MSLDGLSKYEIIDKFTIAELQQILITKRLHYKNFDNYNDILNHYFRYFVQPIKIFPIEILNTFKVSTLEILCLDYSLITTTSKYKNNIYKLNLIGKYLEFIENATVETHIKLTSSIPAEITHILYAEDLKCCNVVITNSKTYDKPITIDEIGVLIYNCILQNIRYLITADKKYDVIQLLYFIPTLQLNTIIDLLNYSDFDLNIDDKITLCIWHLHTNVTNYNFNVTSTKLALVHLDLIGLYNSIIGTYDSNIDTASLLFTFNTHLYPPIKYKHPSLELYKSLLNTDPGKIYYMSQFYPENKLLSIYKNISTFPYNYIFLPIINILTNVTNTTDINTLIQNFGIILPDKITNVVEYLTTEFKYYYKIFIRTNNNIGLPPTSNCNVSDLEWYTDMELYNYYDLTDIINVFTTRLDLLNRISMMSSIKVIWHTSIKKPCNNNLHIIDMESKINTTDNPLIAYGNYLRYRTYNLDELQLSFKDYESDGFRFRIPDASDAEADFILNDIKELSKFIVNLEGKYDDFIKILNDGIKELGNITIRLQSFKKNINIESLIKLGVIVFVTGMYMRKWNGPGFAYPYKLSDHTSSTTNTFRNTSTSNMLSEYFCWLQSLPYQIKNKIISFPRIKYNFNSTDINIGSESIFNIFTLAADGNFCLSHCSDICLQTSFVIFTKILELSVGSFNILIKNYLNVDKIPYFYPDHMKDTGHKDPINKLQDL